MFMAIGLWCLGTDGFRLLSAPPCPSGGRGRSAANAKLIVARRTIVPTAKRAAGHWHHRTNHVSNPRPPPSNCSEATILHGQRPPGSTRSPSGRPHTGPGRSLIRTSMSAPIGRCAVPRIWWKLIDEVNGRPASSSATVWTGLGSPGRFPALWPGRGSPAKARIPHPHRPPPPLVGRLHRFPSCWGAVAR